MPRVSPLPDRDREIGKRLASARKELLIPRTAMAVKVGISTDRLVSYEFGRVKLPWNVGHLLCFTFQINPVWLATGKGDRWDLDWDYDERLLTALGPRPVFSEVVDEIIAPLNKVGAATPSPRVLSVLRSFPEAKKKRSPSGPFLTVSQSVAWDTVAFGVLRSAFASIPDESLLEFVDEISESIAKALRARKRTR